ncbi:MAG TPA: hypothetical protein VEC08_06010, partial [Nitrososphaerales archaeon]|nr:hypothetical protein [Nitrososphaerales archaeon]
AIRKAVVACFLHDMTRREIEKEIQTTFRKKIGGGSVSNIESEFENAVEEVGLEVAGGDFGVNQLVADLKEVGDISRRSGVDLATMTEGGKLALALKERHIPVSEVSKYVFPVYDGLKREGFDPEQVVSQVKDLNSLVGKYGSFEKLKTDFQKTARMKEEAEEEERRVRERIGNANKDLGSLEKQYRVSLEEAKAYSEARRRLQSVGLDMDDLSSAEKCLSGMKAKEFNPTKVVAALKRIESLDGRIASLQGQLSSLSEEVGLKERQLKKTVKELEGRTAELDEARLLRRAGLDIETIGDIRNTVEIIARKRKINSPEAIKLLKTDILERYDVVLGLKADIVRLKGDSADLEEKISKLEDQKKKLEKLYDSRKSQIDAFEHLVEKGIDGDVIMGWEDTISKSGLDAKLITAELKTYSSLKPTLNSLGTKIRDAEAEASKLNAKIESLEDRKNQLEAAIDEVTQKGVKEIDAHGEKTLKSVKDSVDNIKVRVGEVAKSVTETVTTVNSDLGTLQGKVNDITKKAIETGQELGKREAWKGLIRFYEKGEGTKTEVLMFSVTYVSNLERWAAGLGLGEVQTAATKLGEKMHSAYIGP